MAAAFCLVVGLAWGKAPPEWLRPYLLEDVTELSRGQAAVLLVDAGDVRYVTEDRVKRLYRGAIRVATDAGRNQAKCVYGYNADTEKIRGARAWLISADGKSATEVPLREFADSAGQVGKFFWPQQRVLSFFAGNRVETGGVLAWEFEVESQSGISDIGWSFSSHLPVNVSVLEVAPPPGGKLEWHARGERVGPPAAGAAPGALRWGVRHVAAPTGDRPDGFFPAPLGVSVRAVVAGGPQTWAGFARLAAAVIEPRVVITPEVRAKAEALTAGKTTRWERVRALTEFVQKEISYLAVTLDKDYLAGYRPHAAGEVLQNRYGDCKDKSALLAALLRALGEQGSVVLVYAGNPAGVQRDWPSASFNHAIAAMPADEAVPAGWPVVDAGELGRLVLFDPTDPQTPLGSLGPGVSGGFGLVASDRTTDLVAMPVAAAAQNRHVSRIEAALEADGRLGAGGGGVAAGLHLCSRPIRPADGGQPAAGEPPGDVYADAAGAVEDEPGGRGLVRREQPAEGGAADAARRRDHRGDARRLGAKSRDRDLPPAVPARGDGGGLRIGLHTRGGLSRAEGLRGAPPARAENAGLRAPSGRGSADTEDRAGAQAPGHPAGRMNAAGPDARRGAGWGARLEECLSRSLFCGAGRLISRQP
ncbi:MAG: DUF3857 domain-containing protein [Verrucomicrobia bacterium]|nr:DUF3857 domain-containing protein [Verrucomicrobiota bacterium]